MTPHMHTLRDFQAAEAAATRARTIAALPAGAPRMTIATFWEHHQVLIRQIPDVETKFRQATDIANSARVSMEALSMMGEADAYSLDNYAQAIEFGGLKVYGSRQLTSPTELLKAHPVLGPVYLQMEQRRADVAAMVVKADEQKTAEREALAPAQILAHLRASGIELAVDKAGNLTAPAGAALSDDQRIEVSQFKGGLVSLLKVEAANRAEAARPVVIA